MLHRNWWFLVICLFKSIECVTQLFPVHLNNNGNGSSARYQLNQKIHENNNNFNDYGSMDQDDTNTNYVFNHNHNLHNDRGGKAYANPGLNSNSLSTHDSSLWTSKEDLEGSSVISNSPLETSNSGGRDSYNSGDLATAADGHILGYGLGHHGGHGWNNFGHHHHHQGWTGWHPTKAYHYQIYPIKSHGHGHGHHHHHLGWGWNYDQGWSDYGYELWEKFSGFAGLKGVNIVSFLKSVLIAIPIILGILVLLFFLPVPVFLQTNPFCGRTNKLWQETGRLTRDILESDQCVERIACEIEKVAHKYNKAQWIPIILKNVPMKSNSKWMERISTTLNNHEKKISKDSKCSKFVCNPLSHIRKVFKLE